MYELVEERRARKANKLCRDFNLRPAMTAAGDKARFSRPVEAQRYKRELLDCAEEPLAFYIACIDADYTLSYKLDGTKTHR